MSGYVERFPGASTIGGIVAFCIILGISYLLDPTVIDFNDEGGFWDFVCFVALFGFLTCGNCFGSDVKKYGED